MKPTSFHIVRVGLAITFLWIGILIFRDPEAWGGMIQPWAADLLLFPLKETMLSAAVLDIVVGTLLLINVFTWFAALVGTFHLGVVLVTAGFNDITIRDIGLLAAALALALETWPERFRFWRK